MSIVKSIKICAGNHPPLTPPAKGEADLHRSYSPEFSAHGTIGDSRINAFPDTIVL